jgi:site-specific recombinase XerD
MPRRIKSADLDTRSARAKLQPRGKPYWQRIDRELHLGYRKGQRDGQWVRRIYAGAQRYDVETFAAADDRSNANGVTVLDWAQAQEKARELRDAFVRRQVGIEEPKEPYAVKKAVEEYVADLRARKGEDAAKDANGRLKKHLLPEFGDKLLADLTTADLNGWRNGMVKEEGNEEEIRRSRDTANRVRTSAFAAFNLAFQSGRVDDDRAWRRVKPFKNVGEARKIILTDTQQQNLVDACDSDLREFALLVARTGARPGRELTEAKVRDLDLDHATLTVRGKTGAREIHLAPDALRQLRRLASGKRPGDYLLTTAQGGPWTKSLHQRPVAAAVEKAGLDPETTLYALRHSYISGSLMKGTPVKAVADQCGTSIAMIQRYYAKFIPGDLAKYARKAAPKLRDEPVQKVTGLKVVA